MVGLGCLVMQLLAVLPYKNCKHGCEHWATISDSTIDSREIPDEIPNKGYDYHKVAYNLWNAIEGFCTHANVFDECEWVTTEILGRGGGREDESCRGRGKQCEDHFAATNTARATTCVALIFAGIVGLGILFVNIRAHLVGSEPEASPKAIFGAAAVLAVGGVVGLAGAANYRSTVAAAVEKGDVSLIYGSFGHRGCDLSLYGGLVAMVVGMAFAAYEAYFNREELRGIDVKAMAGALVSKAGAPVFPRAFELVALLGLVCVVLQAMVLGAWMRWARFFLVGSPLTGCPYYECQFTYNVEYGLSVFDVQEDNYYGSCQGDCRPDDDDIGTWEIEDKDKCTHAMSTAEQACIENEDCRRRHGTNGFCKEVIYNTILARDKVRTALVFALIAGLGCLFECVSRHRGSRNYPEEYKSMVFLGFSTLLWIGGAVSVGGADEYEQMTGELGEGFIFDKTANDGICLEGCQLAKAAGGIALAGGLVAMLLQCYRCAKSCDSGEEQTASAPPMNEKRESLNLIENSTTDPPECLPMSSKEASPVYDLARLGKAAQSSNYNSHMIASMAIRGSRSSARGFRSAGDYAHTKGSQNGSSVWWKCKLGGAPAHVERVAIFGRPGYGRRLMDLRIELLDKAGAVVYTLDVPNESQSEAFEIILNPPVMEVKTFRLSKTKRKKGDDGSLNLNCVQVFGRATTMLPKRLSSLIGERTPTAPELEAMESQVKADAAVTDTAETAERPGFAIKLSSFLFGEQEPVAEPEAEPPATSHAVRASDHI